MRLNNSITGCVIRIKLQFFNLADYEIFRINSACSRGYNNVAYFDFVVLCNLRQTGKIIVTIFSVSAYDSVVGSLLSIADALVSGERIVLTRQVVSSTSLTQPIRPFSVITGSFFPHCLLNPCQE